MPRRFRSGIRKNRKEVIFGFVDSVVTWYAGSRKIIYGSLSDGVHIGIRHLHGLDCALHALFVAGAATPGAREGEAPVRTIRSLHYSCKESHMMDDSLTVRPAPWLRT